MFALKRSALKVLLVALLSPAMTWAMTDPTRPQDLPKPVPASVGDAGAVVAEEGYALNYVLVSGARRYAVINGVTVNEGDRVGKARVLKIAPGRVRLRVAGEVKELELGFNDIKRQGGGRVSR